ncbi:unnamed protein product [Prorocentrum cordatum]|uniref:Uncharacterized protein n=1 Tax=Prorocentrum cordatum TaxID=2364126 RepID=A0ABN9XVB1_9DINO|nr:unnamed protein product [Polarella glacialis]
MPDTKACETYVSCPYDWSCPSGPDPVTGDGCDVQAGIVAAVIAVAFFIVSSVGIRYFRRMSVVPTRGIVNIRGLDPSGDPVEVVRTRTEGVVDEDGQQKTRLHYDLTMEQMAQFDAYEDRERGCANLRSLDPGEDSFLKVDLNLSGTMDFELHLTIRTKARDSLLFGKVFPNDKPPFGIGKAKALLIKHGKLCWQVGESCITGKTDIADGFQHKVSVGYRAHQEQYYLEVDGSFEAKGLCGVADHQDTILVLGKETAPRNDEFNELYPLFEDLHGSGFEMLSAEQQGEAPLFDGDVDHRVWKEYRWNKNRGRYAWFAYALCIESGEVIDHKMSKQEAEEEKHHSTQPQSVVSPPHWAYHKNQDVEYWSATLHRWLPARIIDSRGMYFDEYLKFNVLHYEVYVGASRQLVHGVVMNDLRLPIVDGDLISVYSHKHRRFFPALVRKSMRHIDPRMGYDIELEDELADDGETYTKSELQKDLEIENRGRKSDAAGRNSNLDGVGELGRRGERPLGVPALRDLPEQGVEEYRLIKNMLAKLVRKRYKRGDLVRVYMGVDAGFVMAEVVREELAGETSASQGGKGARPSPNPGRGDDGKAAEGAPSLPRNRREERQRHAMVVVSIVSRSEGSPGEDQWAGVDAMLGDSEMTMAEFLQRRPNYDLPSSTQSNGDELRAVNVHPGAGTAAAEPIIAIFSASTVIGVPGYLLHPPLVAKHGRQKQRHEHKHPQLRADVLDRRCAPLRRLQFRLWRASRAREWVPAQIQETRTGLRKLIGMQFFFPLKQPPMSARITSAVAPLFAGDDGPVGSLLSALKGNLLSSARAATPTRPSPRRAYELSS